MILSVPESKDEEALSNDKKRKAPAKGRGKAAKKKIESESEDDEDVDDESDDEPKPKGADLCLHSIAALLRVGLYLWMNKNHHRCPLTLFEILGWLEFLAIPVLRFICVSGYCA